jgi:hypothetical protein
MWGYDNQRCEEDCETGTVHEEDRDFRHRWREPPSQEEHCRRLNRDQLVEPLVHCTAGQ